MLPREPDEYGEPALLVFPVPVEPTLEGCAGRRLGFFYSPRRAARAFGIVLGMSVMRSMGLMLMSIFVLMLHWNRFGLFLDGARSVGLFR
jgi:hypothetical protein